jgi:uncharacterized phage protein (TIGR02218 family)
MKPASAALVAYIDCVRSGDQPLRLADCFTFLPQNGANGYFTNLDQPVALNGNTFLADSVLVEGLKYKAGIGLDVDSQKITISANPADTINGVPFLNAIIDGVFDGAEFQRDRVFFSSWSPLTTVGSVTLFKGRVGPADDIGRLSANVTVKSDLVLLDIDMPRNLFSQTCIWTLYGAGCSLSKANFATAGSAGAGSTQSVVNWTGALAVHTQGRLIWTSGANAGTSCTVKLAVPGASLQPIRPFFNAPQAGDAFTVYQGCAHTMSVCQSQFNNLPNFRGYPFVPPPDVAF